MQTKLEIKSNTIQNTMVITCSQNKVDIMSNSILNTMVITYMKKESKDQFQLNPERHNGREESQFDSEQHVGHLHLEQG